MRFCDRWRRLGQAIVKVCLVGTFLALHPAAVLSQHLHDRWTAEGGFPGGTVFAICQSQDGYLWIGTERGLVRFDGTDFTLMQRPISGSLPIGAVRGLVADSEGNLWIRLDGPHLLRYRKGSFEDVFARFNLQEFAFTSMALDLDGTLLLWGPQNGLMRFHGEAFEKLDTADDIRNIVISITERADHQFWMGTRGAGLYHTGEGHAPGALAPLALTSVNTLLPSSYGLWIGTDAGLKFWDGQHLAKPAMLGVLNRLQVVTLIHDHQGNIWAGTNHGLFRISSSMFVSAEPNDPEQGAVLALYEDREGSVWFGGSRGLERLRDGIFTGYSASQGLPSVNDGPIYVDEDERTWFAPSLGGLYWLKDGRVHQVSVAGLDHDVVYSISGGGGEIWIGRQHTGLTKLTMKGKAFVAQSYTEADGLAQDSIYAVHRDRDGTVWAATVNRGISMLKNSQFTNYSVANGLLSNSVFAVTEALDGTIWLATSGGLQSFANGRWRSFGVKEGLPSTSVRTIFEDSQHSLWVATTGGLAYITSGQVHVPKNLPDSLRDDALGIAEDRSGSLWILTSDQVLQVSRTSLLDDSIHEVNVQSYGPKDGLPGTEGVRRDRSLVTDRDGRVWVSLRRGLGMADPARAAERATPTAVRIEAVLGASGVISPSDFGKLPAGTHSITLKYGSSNLAQSQRVRFRYRLDGSDPDWSGDVALRQVVYTNLGPGAYTFRIVGSDSAGRWNGPETKVKLVIEPAYWQSWWFQLLALAVLFATTLLMMRLRAGQITRSLNARFQERLAERTLIAQDLHDTLLQGVLSASMQLDVVEDQTPNDSPTRPKIRRILLLMEQVTEEGRNTLRGLRVPQASNLAIEAVLSRLEGEFALPCRAAYRVISHGEHRPLRPIIRDEVYRIGREAVTNAFLHAKAAAIEVDVEYTNAFFRVVVRDDGCGIEPELLKKGREGHWGLSGMHERSKAIGATLRVRSRAGAGTEVEITIPRAIAFEGQAWTKLAKLYAWLGRE